MKKIETKIKDCFLFETERYSDNRGYFQETFQKNRYDSFLPSKTNFVQDNLSYSIKNVLRGIHFQYHKPQGKLVRVTKGSALDVAVDLRVNSTSFGKHISLILNDKNNNCKKVLYREKCLFHFLIANTYFTGDLVLSGVSNI